MGEVWRAEDEKVGRQVALKVLPEEFAKDPERMARFEREAKVLDEFGDAVTSEWRSLLGLNNGLEVVADAPVWVSDLADRLATNVPASGHHRAALLDQLGLRVTS